MKTDLRDVTFIIPFYKDSKERLENLKCVIEYIYKDFNTNVEVVDSSKQRAYIYPDFPDDCYNENCLLTWNDDLVSAANEIFHRTKVINHGIKHADTPYIAIYDTDVIFKPEQIIEAVEKLRAGATLVYPYSGDFVDINRSYIQDGVVIERESFTKESVGGACFLNREDYFKCGLENCNYKSWCPDDVDRYHRVKTLGYKIERVEGKCWHINHPASPNSGVNKFTQANNAEWIKIKEMNKEQLTEYISTWEWAKN